MYEVLGANVRNGLMRSTFLVLVRMHVEHARSASVG